MPVTSHNSRRPSGAGNAGGQAGPRRPASRARRMAPVEAVMRGLSLAIDGMELPAIEKISEDQAEDPFQVLIATLLSARTQDATTLAASRRLFRRARTPATMARLPVREIESLIYPVSFYRNKARFVKATCDALVRDHGGKVPTSLDQMVSLPGVGRKTANLVMILAYRSQRNICVDTHVHRIANRLGWVRTDLPDQTEAALYESTEPRWWPYINLYLVTWGQNVCRPVFPRCGDCAIASLCPRIGVVRVGRSRQGAIVE
jgi:endonuclease-3